MATLRRANSALLSAGMSDVIPVEIGPGQMQFTVMFFVPNSTASERVNPMTPVFAAV